MTFNGVTTNSSHKARRAVSFCILKLFARITACGVAVNEAAVWVAYACAVCVTMGDLHRLGLRGLCGRLRGSLAKSEDRSLICNLGFSKDELLRGSRVGHILADLVSLHRQLYRLALVFIICGLRCSICGLRHIQADQSSSLRQVHHLALTRQLCRLRSRIRPIWRSLEIG